MPKTTDDNRTAVDVLESILRSLPSCWADDVIDGEYLGAVAIDEADIRRGLFLVEHPLPEDGEAVSDG